MNIVLLNPQIPQNTGNIARLCAGTDSELHLVGELGFSLEDRYLKRAGLDYWPHVRLRLHETLDDALAAAPPEQVAFFSAHGTRLYTEFPAGPDAWFVFGREADGLPADVREANAERLYRIPTNRKIRSLNLANAVAVVVFEALRTNGFPVLG